MELKLPTEAEKEATATAFKNLSDMLKAGWFTGANAKAVAAAIDWADGAANFFNTTKPELKVVENEQA